MNTIKESDVNHEKEINQSQSKKSKSLEWIVALMIGLIVSLLIRHFIFTPFNVSGESMMPTFKDKDNVIINKLYHQPQKGDVIILDVDGGKRYIKRVIATEGDELQYKKDQLYINHKKVNEPYLNELKKKTKQQITQDINQISDLPNTNGQNKVPKDHLLVMGDNRLNSLDSRYGLGFVKESDIEGKVIMRYYPFNSFKFDFDTH